MKEPPSLTEVFTNLPNSLLHRDGIKPLFFILRSVIVDSSNALFESAKQTLADIESAVDSDGSYDTDQIVSIIVPFLLKAMSNADEEFQQNAAWVIAILVKKGFHSDEIVPIAIDWLDSNTEMKILHATWILRNCTWSKFDVSEAISSVQTHLEHDDYVIRNYTAQVISNELLRSGDESLLTVHPDLMEHERLDPNYWTVEVHHRRHHARTNNAILKPKYTPHFRTTRMCGNCGDPNAICIYYYDDSGTGWTDRTHECFCPKCEKYTVYHYVA